MLRSFNARVRPFLVFTIVYASIGTEPVRAEEPFDPQIVRIRIDLVPDDLRGEIDTCAIDREEGGPFAVFYLDPQRAAELTVPHERLGPLSAHIRRFLPANTLARVDIPSIRNLLGLPAPADQPQPNGPPALTLSYDVYHTLEEGHAFFQALAGAFSNIAQVVNIGTSVQNRSILALRLTANPTQPNTRQKILFTAVTHAREWATHEAVLYFAEKLCHGYGSDPRITHILDRAEVWLVSAVNPDGYAFSWSDQRMWRKNRRDNPGTSCDGIDINRNYTRGWGGPGSSGSFCNETYRGPSAGSEPETQAIQNLLAAQRFAIAVGYHTYSQLMLYSWGDTTQVAPESYSSLRAIAKKYVSIINDTTGFQYLPGQSSYTIYLTSGGFDDQAYGISGALAFTPELRPVSTAQGGFLLPEDQILPNNIENFAAALWLMDNVANALPVSNPMSPTLIESPSTSGNRFSLPATPINQKPSLALGFNNAWQSQLTTWMHDGAHNPPAYATLNTGFEGCGTGNAYVLTPTAPALAWAQGLTQYTALPHVYDNGAEILLSNVGAGVNRIGILSPRPMPLAEVRVVQRVLEFVGPNYGYREIIQESRTAVEDATNASPWLDWNWSYQPPTGAPIISHPSGAGGADLMVYPFRGYDVTVNVGSSAFSSTTVPVYLLQFPAVDLDCNRNAVADAQDIAGGFSLDCDADGIPDECEKPPCTGLIMGDLDCSGTVNGGDVQDFARRIASGAYTCQADLNGDLAVDYADVMPFIDLCLQP